MPPAGTSHTMAGNHSRKGSVDALGTLNSGPRSPRGDMPHSNHEWQRNGRYQRSGSTASNSSSIAGSLDISVPNRLGTVTETSQNGMRLTFEDSLLTTQPSRPFCNLPSYGPVFSPTHPPPPLPPTGLLLRETYLRSPCPIYRTSTPRISKHT
jgi:hypothetical protein